MNINWKPVAVTAGMTLTLIIATHATHASAVAHAPASAQSRTCAAYAAWKRHPSAAGLDVMMTDSFGVPWKYLASDVTHLYADVRDRSAVRYVRHDEKYVTEDCTAA
jgi:hypothetical protein